MEIEQVAKLMALIGVEFSGRFETTKDRLGLWAQALVKVDYEDGKAAVCQAMISAGQWPPTIGDVVKKLEEIYERKRYRQLQKIEADKEKQSKQFLINCDNPEPISNGGKSPGHELLKKLISDLSKKTKEIV